MIRVQACLVAAFVGALGLVLRAQDVAAAWARSDFGLILRTWRVKGVLACPRPCLWVENAFPVGVFEITRRPYRSALREFDVLLGPLARLGPRTTSSHTGASDGAGSTLQFADARVYEMVPPLDVPWIARPPRSAAALCYVSELDRLAWGSALPDLLLHPAESAVLCDLPPRPKRVCAGAWGNYYPRHGAVVRDSEPLAAILQALRAGRAASEPAGRVVLRRYPWEPRTGHWIQPEGRAAIRIGDPDLAGIERGAGRLDGGYLYVHFGIFERCGRCIPGRLVGER